MLKNKHSQRGMTLVEAMIALLVISVGLLGIASLQLTAMSQNTSSLNHSKAVWLAYNMYDRIIANNDQFDNYNGIDSDNNYNGDCMANTCTPAQMITADADEWTSLLDELPGGEGTVIANADGLVITVMWDDEGTGADVRGCRNNPDQDLTCYRMVVSR